MQFITPIHWNKPVILDLGSGYNPEPNCYHIDVRPDLPDIDLVMDIKDRLPFGNGSIDGIVANHLIEHIKWTEIKTILTDWFRVLKVGGFLRIRTPDLKFIVSNYLNGIQTKEFPLDEENAVKTFGQCGPSEIALIKLFSGQDYDSNVHYACYDFKMLLYLLRNVGFSNVTLCKFEKEYSPGELQVIAYKSQIDTNI